MGTVTRMELRKIDELHPYERNAKLHPPEQIEKLRKSFREFALALHDFALLFDRDGNPLNPPEHPGSDDDPALWALTTAVSPCGSG